VWQGAEGNDVIWRHNTNPVVDAGGVYRRIREPVSASMEGARRTYAVQDETSLWTVPDSPVELVQKLRDRAKKYRSRAQTIRASEDFIKKSAVIDGYMRTARQLERAAQELEAMRSSYMFRNNAVPAETLEAAQKSLEVVRSLHAVLISDLEKAHANRSLLELKLSKVHADTAP
jgi:hypothetical protein